ncbi:MAG: cystathionine beta-lyase [Parvibaculaceae bacterium]|jgi:cystathionine beta-lyase
MTKPDAPDNPGPPAHHKDTRITKAGLHPHEQNGIVNPPVYHGSTILFETMAELENNTKPVSYGRRGSPTIFTLQEAIAELEGGYKTVLTPSGLSAVSISLLSHLRSGDHLLMTDTAYEPSRIFCDRILTDLGVEVEYYDPTIGSGIKALLRDNTKVVFAESPGSQTFEIQDLPAISAAAHAAGAIVIFDNTWASPYYLNPFKLGVDVSLQAATKYIVGHSDALLGAITSNEKTYARTLRGHGAMGMSVGPDDVYLAQRGLRTLAVRMKQHMQTGIGLATWLETRPEVERVIHPALPSHPEHDIWKRDFTGASGLFGVVLKPVSDKSLGHMLDNLKLFGMGFSWGGFESLIIPAHPEKARTATRWAENGPLLRIHAGLEDINDLQADLAAGLERLSAPL